MLVHCWRRRKVFRWVRCACSIKPRELDETQKAFLRLMARQVMKLLELRRINAGERAARLQAEELVRENETLIREGDHRVMNSLQLVQSVLSLQSRNAVSPETKAQLDMASNRVLAIATVHKQLHLTGSLEEIDFDAFLHRLSESLKSTAPPHITAIKVTAENSRLRSDLASGMGMLVAELVTNSFKHAYTDGQRGIVAVDFRQTANGWCLEVSDEGQGLPAGNRYRSQQGRWNAGRKSVRAAAGEIQSSMFPPRPGRTVFQINSIG